MGDAADDAEFYEEQCELERLMHNTHKCMPHCIYCERHKGWVYVWPDGEEFDYCP